jgi:predicted MPP superfamily phosphohydrolase
MPWIYRMALRIFLFALPLFIYYGFRLSSAIAKATESSRFPVSKKMARLMVFALILWFYLWPIILGYYRLNGNIGGLFVFQHHLVWQDYLILFPAWCGLIAMIETLPYFIVSDLFGLATRLKRFSPEKKQRIRKSLAWLKTGIAVFFLLYVGVRTYWDTNHVRISPSQVAIKNLPEELRGLRLTFFGDVHMSRYMHGKKLDILKKTLKAGDQDLIFFSGDLTSRGDDFLGKVFQLLNQPRAKLGAVACMGDHDYWTAPNRIANELQNRGWNFLQNRHRLFTYKGRRILVTGLTYVYSNRISRRELKNLLANAPEADLKIMLVHQPREFLVETAAQYGYHLFLGGHTHGGEVVNHVFGIPYSPGLKETRYCWGQHTFNDLKIVITNGIGRTLAALRYHAPAQITQLTLVRQP